MELLAPMLSPVSPCPSGIPPRSLGTLSLSVSRLSDVPLAFLGGPSAFFVTALATPIPPSAATGMELLAPMLSSVSPRPSGIPPRYVGSFLGGSSLGFKVSQFGVSSFLGGSNLGLLASQGDKSVVGLFGSSLLAKEPFALATTGVVPLVVAVSEPSAVLSFSPVVGLSSVPVCVGEL